MSVLEAAAVAAATTVSVAVLVAMAVMAMATMPMVEAATVATTVVMVAELKAAMAMVVVEVVPLVVSPPLIVLCFAMFLLTSSTISRYRDHKNLLLIAWKFCPVVIVLKAREGVLF